MLAKEIAMAQPTNPAWIQTLQQRDPQFAESYMAQREHILQDGAIPAKYKILMTMIVDAITAHADGVANIANRARAAGATEAEINETGEVAYLFGGTPALVKHLGTAIQDVFRPCQDGHWQRQCLRRLGQPGVTPGQGFPHAQIAMQGLVGIARHEAQLFLLALQDETRHCLGGNLLPGII